MGQTEYEDVYINGNRFTVVKVASLFLLKKDGTGPAIIVDLENLEEMGIKLRAKPVLNDYRYTVSIKTEESHQADEIMHRMVRSVGKKHVVWYEENE